MIWCRVIKLIKLADMKRKNSALGAVTGIFNPLLEWLGVANFVPESTGAFEELRNYYHAVNMDSFVAR